MTSMLERDLGNLDAPFEPLAVDARHPPPRATIDPDRSLGWLRRMRPLLAARRWAFAGSLLAALVAMLAQVAAPRVVMAAIDDALTARTADIWPFVWVLAALGVTRGLLTYVYRDHLYRLA